MEQALEFVAVPGLHQVLRACLAQGDDRPSIAELLSMLVELQQQQQRCRVDWIQGGGSTLGLSDSRWTNEDSYGVRYQVQSPTFPTVIMGVLADGMGGLEQGEVASQCTVQTLLTAPLPKEASQVQVSKTLDRWQQWLIDQIQDANQKIVRTIRNGGTTLSVVLGVADHLLIAHVGDSRIFLIRNGHICQLSEDHSLVQNLWVTGQISYAEMQDHPDRNVLLKSLGSHRLLKTDIQTLQKFGSELSLSLQYGDILLLCSDGVWDLVPPDELCEIFAPLSRNTDHSVTSLQPQIDQVLQRVIDRGAHDNATIIGLRCLISPLFS
jgi:protein phosphatase